MDGTGKWGCLGMCSWCRPLSKISQQFITGRLKRPPFFTTNCRDFPSPRDRRGRHIQMQHVGKMRPGPRPGAGESRVAQAPPLMRFWWSPPQATARIEKRHSARAIRMGIPIAVVALLGDRRGAFVARLIARRIGPAVVCPPRQELVRRTASRMVDALPPAKKSSRFDCGANQRKLAPN